MTCAGPVGSRPCPTYAARPDHAHQKQLTVAAEEVAVIGSWVCNSRYTKAADEDSRPRHGEDAKRQATARRSTIDGAIQAGRTTAVDPIRGGENGRRAGLLAHGLRDSWRQIQWAWRIGAGVGVLRCWLRVAATWAGRLLEGYVPRGRVGVGGGLRAPCRSRRLVSRRHADGGRCCFLVVLCSGGRLVGNSHGWSKVSR